MCRDHVVSKYANICLGGLVFSKCAESMENGRRLENISWRIWNRETLCCESQPLLTTTPAIDFSQSRPNRKDVPELSGSVDSVTSDETELMENHQHERTAPVYIKSHASRDGDAEQGTGRGREKHITSLGLEKMMISIKEKQDIQPLSPTIARAVSTRLPSLDITPQPALTSLHLPLRSSDSSTSTAPVSSPESDRSATHTNGSDTSAEILNCHSVVRGFSPNHISSSYRSYTHLAPASIASPSVSHAKTEDVKPSATFLLGGSSGEDESSFDDRMSSQPRLSSLTAGLKRPLTAKKQTSFRDEVESRTMNKSLADEEVFESDDDDEDSPESAIEDDEDDEEDDDDDGSEWEDSISDNDDTLENDKQLFKRVDSRPHLPSRRSLLTISLMNQDGQATTLERMTSKSTSALQRQKSKLRNGSSSGTSPEETAMPELPHGTKMTKTKPIIMTTSNIHPPALSPRTTRRNMLATELTESLRKHLLWERQQKSTTANAVLKRRHTAFDVANLQEYPGHRSGLLSKDGSKNNSWNHYFDHGPGEYHQAGW